MTNKKAIRVLENIEHYLKTHTNESCEEEHTAIALAIKALEERPQGDLADEVWKLYEKHQSHLATYVYEFGIELKDLLSKYQKGGTE